MALTAYQRIVLAMAGLSTPGPGRTATPDREPISDDEAIREAGRNLSTATDGAAGEDLLRSVLGSTTDPVRVHAAPQVFLDEVRLMDLDSPAGCVDIFESASPFSLKLALGLRSEKPKTQAQQQARKKAKASRQARKANRR